VEGSPVTSYGPTGNRNGKAWHFRTFLIEAPRVGALGKLFTENKRPFFEEVDRVVQVYLSGNLSHDLEQQFVQWMRESNIIERV
jgi:hypothetical protein